ncbi:aminotransferase class III-fold pyridoxal phosphate-dependent enzyme [Ideonella livida]|uniref:Aminotransferase class III-fold pyridoxal phosphate-dependent enzyme n=1 Tax=Ideonella livida TaxID=2707176 RepID=A0A7C9PKY0_9BURK|nr:aminotransferase class III-fold pyridoxal phosphate-dependent enzyme [Ideonella livida]NDY93970.1 aminotransferase class III-fold pyridoxal phosphate-dependent enzyme [Ideonella livida]
MDDTLAPFTLSALTLGALAWALPKLRQRLQLSRAKHRSLAGHSRMAKRLARLLPDLRYDETRFFNADGAPAELVARRRAGLTALCQRLAQRHPRSIALTTQAREILSDLQFTGRYRVPLPFSAHLREHLKLGAFVTQTDGRRLQDADGQWFYDLAGSYGVNVLGYDTYKQTLATAHATAATLGPVLGAYHPCVLDNLQRLKALSGLDEVSFHMSGTEAVMQAVRLARYHTGRRHLVRFCGAYHGWWEDVQPGPGNPLPPRETYTLRDMDPRSLQVLRTRRDIACVLVNPLQALHPNANAPADSGLIDGSRRAGFDRAAYTAWLQQLRQVCTERGIVLIFDEVFLGFRLAIGGAQEYFGVQADLVTYGKTLGGGLPVGVVCGRAHLMRRFKPERPADLCLARGTFNAHPMVMAAMNAFLHHLDRPDVQALYAQADALWNQRAAQLNQRLQAAGLPLQVAHLHSVWTLLYTRPSRYHWLLQFYLRDQGLHLSWVGTGRFIFSLDTTDEDFEAITQRLIAGAQALHTDGWWWDSPEDGRTIRRSVLWETLRARWRGLVGGGVRTAG